MIWEILSPWEPRSPMSEPDSWSTIAAGSKVTKGASSGTEYEQQQNNDEQDRQRLGLVARRARLLLLGDVGGDDSGQVELQAWRSPHLREGRGQPVDDILGRPRTEPGDVRLCDKLHGPSVGRGADVLHGDDIRDLLRGKGETGDRLGVGGG